MEEKRYCSKCGKEINADWVFCNYCGNDLKKDEDKKIMLIEQSDLTHNQKIQAKKEMHKLTVEELKQVIEEVEEEKCLKCNKPISTNECIENGGYCKKCMNSIASGYFEIDTKSIKFDNIYDKKQQIIIKEMLNNEETYLEIAKNSKYEKYSRLESTYEEFVHANIMHSKLLLREISARQGYDIALRTHKVDPYIAGGIGQGIAGTGAGIYSAISSANRNSTIDENREYYANKVRNTSFQSNSAEIHLLVVAEKLNNILNSISEIEEERKKEIQELLEKERRKEEEKEKKEKAKKEADRELTLCVIVVYVVIILSIIVFNL